MERFNRWKAEKTKGNTDKNHPPKSQTSCVEKRKSYAPKTIKQGSRNEVKKGAPSKVPVPSGQLRRKTISQLSTTTGNTKPDPSKSRCTRRQTVSSVTLNRPVQPHKSGLTSMKRFVHPHGCARHAILCHWGRFHEARLAKLPLYYDDIVCFRIIKCT